MVAVDDADVVAEDVTVDDTVVVCVERAQPANSPFEKSPVASLRMPTVLAHAALSRK